MVYSSRRLCGESDVRWPTLDASAASRVADHPGRTSRAKRHRGLSSPSRLCERPCQVGDDLVQ